MMNEQMYGLTEDNMMRTLPEVLKRDDKMNTLGLIAADAISKLIAHTGLVQIYSRIYEMAEPVLDVLAIDFKVDWYNYSYSLDTKRLQIHNSFFIHNHLGTRASVMKALSDVFPNSAVEEWYEYGGQPYYFRVIIDITNAQEPANLGSLRHAVDYYKSLRSHLEEHNMIARISSSVEIKTEADSRSYRVFKCGTASNALM